MSNVDIETSQQISKLVRAQPHRCYTNAVLGTFHVENGYYTEGYIVLPIAGGIPLEHGWISVPDGPEVRIIDPTLCDDTLHPHIHYFPARTWPREELAKHLEQTFPLRRVQNLLADSIWQAVDRFIQENRECLMRSISA